MKIMPDAELEALKASALEGDVDSVEALTKEVKRLSLLLAPSDQARAAIETFQKKRAEKSRAVAEVFRETVQAPGFAAVTIGEGAEVLKPMADAMRQVAEDRARAEMTCQELERENRRLYDRNVALGNARAKAMVILAGVSGRFSLGRAAVTEALEALRAADQA